MRRRAGGWAWSASTTRARAGRSGGAGRARIGCRGSAGSRRVRRASTCAWRGGCASCRRSAAAFGEGKLSYSKVRALTRVENVEREEELLELARARDGGAAGAPGARAPARGGGRARGGRRRAGALADARARRRRVRPGARPAARRGGRAADGGARAARDRLTAEDVPAGTLGGDPDGVQGRSRGNAASRLPARRAPTRCWRSRTRSWPAGTRLADGGGSAPGGRCTSTPRRCRATRVSGASSTTARRSQPRPRGGWRVTPRWCGCSSATAYRCGSVARRACSRRALRRALNARDGGCRFPGCASRRFVDAHHIEHWADGGATDLDNLVQLCGHHHRLLHEGRYAITRQRRRPADVHAPRRPPHRRAVRPRAHGPPGAAPAHPPARRVRVAEHGRAPRSRPRRPGDARFRAARQRRAARHLTPYVRRIRSERPTSSVKPHRR